MFPGHEPIVVLTEGECRTAAPFNGRRPRFLDPPLQGMLL